MQTEASGFEFRGFVIKAKHFLFALLFLILMGCERKASTPVVAGKPHVYDKAKYHYGTDCPTSLPEEKSFVPTGMFFGWLVEHNMIKQEFDPNTADFIARRITGPKLYEAGDGCLIDEMLTDEGNRFAMAYFDFEHGKYLADYQELLTKGLPSLYHVADTWDNYDIIKKRIDERYEAWKKQQK
jgi:hypothetical protein